MPLKFVFDRGFLDSAVSLDPETGKEWPIRERDLLIHLGFLMAKSRRTEVLELYNSKYEGIEFARSRAPLEGDTIHCAPDIIFKAPESHQRAEVFAAAKQAKRKMMSYWHTGATVVLHANDARDGGFGGGSNAPPDDVHGTTDEERKKVFYEALCSCARLSSILKEPMMLYINLVDKLPGQKEADPMIFRTKWPMFFVTKCTVLSLVACRSDH